VSAIKKSFEKNVCNKDNETMQSMDSIETRQQSFDHIDGRSNYLHLCRNGWRKYITTPRHFLDQNSTGEKRKELHSKV